jgi:hypothetical protein
MVIVAFGFVMFPVADMGLQIDVLLGAFFFYYVLIMVCVLKACDQWFKTCILLSGFHAYYFIRFSGSNLFKT